MKNSTSQAIVTENASMSRTPRTARRERLLMTVALSFVLLVVFAVGEVALRVISKTSAYAPKVEMPFYEKHSYLGKTLTPNARYSTSSVTLTVNSRGFRGAEFDVPKPSNRFRIFALGGSTTFGFFPGISSDQATYPAQLEQQLNASLPGDKKVEVINAGVSGYSVRTSMINFAARILYYQPDMILVYHNTNDLSRYGHEEELLYPLDKLADRRTGIEKIAEDLFGWSYLLTELQYTVVNRLLPIASNILGSSGQDVVSEVETAWQEDTRYSDAFKRDLESLVAIAKAHNVQVVLMSQSIAITATTDFNHLTTDELAMQLGSPDPYHTAIPPAQRFYMFNRYNQIIEQVANEQHTVFIDVNSAIPKTPAYHTDYCHQTDKGAQLMATTVRDKLLPILQEQLTAGGEIK